MKQNLFEAKALLTITLLVALVSCACGKRQRAYSFDSTTGSSAAEANTKRININTASASELEQLPGIGPVMAERIVQHRLEHGHFRRVEHVMMVRGISERRFLQMEPLIGVK